MPQESNQAFFQQVQLVEQRYEMENQLMEIVRKGLWKQAQERAQLLVDIPRSVLESRTDPSRDAKNYSIILNTLMRKAAEQGGVHPIYIDRLSSRYALRIEAIHQWDSFLRLWRELIKEYSLLVHKHTAKRHSPLVQKAVSRIELDLSADLRLAPMAKALNVNASYLSNLFKKETGQTFTEFVTKKRMEQAMYLLSSTGMRVSAVAQSCGISDDNYFTKLFKRATGLTPLQYRKGQQPHES